MKEDEGRCYNSIGLRYQKAGRYNEALDNYEKSLKIAEEIGDLNNKEKILNNIAYIKWAQGDYEAAKKYFEDSIELHEIFIGEIKTSVEAIDIIEDINPYYGIIELLFDFYKKSNEKKNLYEALKYIELAKILELIEILQHYQIIEKYSPEHIELVKKEKSLINNMFLIKEEINELNKRKRELWGILQKYKQFPDQNTIKDTINKLESEVTILTNQIEEKNNTLLNLGIESRKLRTELFKQLDDSKLIKPTKEYNANDDLMRLFEIENVVIWELFYVPGSILYSDNFKILSIDPKGIELYQINGFDGKKFLDTYKLFYKMITDPVLKYHSFENLTKIKDMIANILPDELLKTLENKSKLILIPHNILHFVPWEIIESIGLKIPMCRNYSLRVLNSCITIDNEKKQGNELLFINNPTFNSYPVTISEKEIKKITSLLDGYKIDYTILENENAEKEKFLEIIKSHDLGVVHFGGYANFDPLNKINILTKGISFIEKIIFTGFLFYNEKDYSLLSINQIINTGFKTSPLFIMNTVELGDLNNSDINSQIILLRGLMMAGISSIIIPNWIIFEDITPEFMLELYHNISSDIDICESLFESRKKIWSELKRPIFYGAYTLYGNPFKKIKFE